MRRYLLILTLTFLYSIKLSASEPLFGPPANYQTGNEPYSLATGDFNEDGNIDIAVANEEADSISLFLGDVEGDFVPGMSCQVAALPRSIAVGDFNGDGHDDLAVAGGWTVTILLGAGDGTFINNGNYDAVDRLFSITTEDFNSDGHYDLAAVSQAGPDFYQGHVLILMGEGDGTFEDPVLYPTWFASCSIDCGDFNEDGNPDLAVAESGEWLSQDGAVSILLGAGDGTFGSAVYYSTGKYSTSVRIGDFNEDGHLDLIVANSGGGKPHSLSILDGLGNGTFAAAENFYPDYAPYSVDCGDFNADGHIDIAAAGHSSDTVTVFLGNGDSSFTPNNYYGVGAFPGFIVADDFDYNGYPDLAVANRLSDQISVLINIAGSTITPDEPKAVAPDLALHQNYPNPFNPHTEIAYSIPVRSRVVLEIFDVEGKLVSRLVDRVMDAGTHHAKWNGRNDNGSAVTSGVYFCKMTARGKSISRKMILMK